jgi:AhpD family alkylhydroperoxidase
MMNKFEHLEDKTIEIAGISASIAGGCRPCLDYHFKKALEIGCSIDQIKEAVELGKMIKQRPINDIYEHAEKLLGKDISDNNKGIIVNL